MISPKRQQGVTWEKEKNEASVIISENSSIKSSKKPLLESSSFIVNISKIDGERLETPNLIDRKLDCSNLYT